MDYMLTQYHLFWILFFPFNPVFMFNVQYQNKIRQNKERRNRERGGERKAVSDTKLSLFGPA